MALRSLVDDLHVQLREGLGRRPAGLRLRAAGRPEGSTSVTELAGLAGMTKQAASKLVDSMEAGGYVARTEGVRRPAAAARSCSPTRAAASSPPSRRSTSGWRTDRWSATIGRCDQVEGLRTELTEVLLDRHGGGLRPVRPPW